MFRLSVAHVSTRAASLTRAHGPVLRKPGPWLGLLIALTLVAANAPSFALPSTSAGSGTLQLSFPFPQGETWAFTGPKGAPISVPGGVAKPAIGYYLPTDTSYASTAVAGGTVVAMRGGTVSIPCAGMVQIDHGGGLSTVYYPLASVAVTAGQVVTRGQALGITTTAAAACGAGASTIPMVNVWALQGTNGIDPVGNDIGGWEVLVGERTSDGCIKRGPTLRCRLTDPFDYPNWYDSVSNDGEIGSSLSPNASMSLENTYDLYVGESKLVQIGSFPAFTNLTLQWRKPNGTLLPLGSVTTNVAGAARTRITIQETPGGGQNAVVATGGSVTRSLTVKVAPYVFYQAGNAGRSNTAVIKGTGYPASTTIPATIALFGQSAVAITPSVVTDANGSFIVSYLVPANAPLGDASIVFTHPVTSVPLVTTLKVVNTASVFVNKNESFPGLTDVAQARRFPANTTVNLTVNGVQVGTGQTDSTGAVDIPFVRSRYQLLPHDRGWYIWCDYRPILVRHQANPGH